MKDPIVGQKVASGAGVSLRLALLGAVLLCGASAGVSAQEVAADQGEPASPRLNIRGFADVTAVGEQTDLVGGGTEKSSAFLLGQLAVHMNSRLSDSVTFLSELVFELGEDNELVTDLERLFIKYSFSDTFRIAAGRVHTALGYWNEVYHHGALLYPTIERPEGLKFEDDGGILPLHSVGLELSGRVSMSSNWGFTYVSNLANGRGTTREMVQGASDANQQKAVSAKLSFEHEGSTRLVFGPAVYADRIPADPLVPGSSDIDEQILGFHFVLGAKALKLYSEYYDVQHEVLATGTDLSHQAWYAIVVIEAWKWKPYVGVDTLDFEAGDPFYAPDDVDLTRYLAGVRYDVNPSNSLKFEYRHDDRGGEKSDVLAIQTAFAF